MWQSTSGGGKCHQWNVKCLSRHQSSFWSVFFCNPSLQQWVKCGRLDLDRMGPECRDRQELSSGQVDQARDKNRLHIRKMLSESTTEGTREFIQKGTMEICEHDSTLLAASYFEEAFSRDPLGACVDMVTIPLTQTYISTAPRSCPWKEILSVMSWPSAPTHRAPKAPTSASAHPTNRSPPQCLETPKPWPTQGGLHISAEPSLQCPTAQVQKPVLLPSLDLYRLLYQCASVLLLGAMSHSASQLDAVQLYNSWLSWNYNFIVVKVRTLIGCFHSLLFALSPTYTTNFIKLMDVKGNCWRSRAIWFAAYVGCPLVTQMRRKTFLSRKNSVPSKILTWHWPKPSAVCVLTTGEKTFIIVEMQYTLTAITVFTLGLVSNRDGPFCHHSVKK